jgi:hypothetical protein
MKAASALMKHCRTRTGEGRRGDRDFFETVTKTSRNEPVRSTLGTFVVAKCAAGMGGNPQTGEGHPNRRVEEVPLPAVEVRQGSRDVTKAKPLKGFAFHASPPPFHLEAAARSVVGLRAGFHSSRTNAAPQADRLARKSVSSSTRVPRVRGMA